MKKLIFLPIFLFGLNFSNCYKKFSKVDYFQITPSIAVSFSKPSKYISYDEITGMYVYKHKGKPLKFLDKFYLGWEMASINKSSIYVSNFSERNFIKDYLAGKIVKNSLISDKFCRLIGIGGEEFFLDKKMISFFINNGYYGNVPITFDNNFRVIRYNPFLVNNVQIGDKLLKINNHPVNFQNFRKFIVFKKIGTKVRLTFANKSLLVKVIKKKIFRNYFVYYGISVDKSLKVTKLPAWIEKKYYINVGSKIVCVNGKKVKNIEGANRYLNGKNDTITFNDNGIFIKVKLNGRVH